MGEYIWNILHEQLHLIHGRFIHTGKRLSTIYQLIEHLRINLLHHELVFATEQSFAFIAFRKHFNKNASPGCPLYKRPYQFFRDS